MPSLTSSIDPPAAARKVVEAERLLDRVRLDQLVGSAR